MKNINLKPVLQGVEKTLKENSPQILLWLGVTCSISAIITAVPSTIKAVRIVDEKKKELHTKKLTFWETLKSTWHCYVPTVILGATSVVCIVESASISSKRTAAIAAAYQLSESAFKEYQNQVVEKIGEKKEKEVQDNVDRKIIQDHPLSQNTVIVTSHGKTLCFDTLSGRYFTSDIDKINKVVNELNREIVSSIDGYVSLNQFYEELMIDQIGIGDELIWSTNGGLIEIKYSSQLSEDNTPCLVLGYRVKPKSL